jgi:hypothetical protein
MANVQRIFNKSRDTFCWIRSAAVADQFHLAYGFGTPYNVTFSVHPIYDVVPSHAPFGLIYFFWPSGNEVLGGCGFFYLSLLHRRLAREHLIFSFVLVPFWSCVPWLSKLRFLACAGLTPRELGAYFLYARIELCCVALSCLDMVLWTVFVLLFEICGACVAKGWPVTFRCDIYAPFSRSPSPRPNWWQTSRFA